LAKNLFFSTSVIIWLAAKNVVSDPVDCAIIIAASRVSVPVEISVKLILSSLKTERNDLPFNPPVKVRAMLLISRMFNCLLTFIPLPPALSRTDPFRFSLFKNISEYIYIGVPAEDL